ncbi:MAG TPA: hypothetical protein VGK11_09065 [Actinomycetota bacterium]
MREPSGWAIGWTVFAGVMMMMIGFWQGIAGLSAIIDDQFFVVVRDYVLKFDVTTWGWIHLVLGTLILLAGFAMFSGAVWARTIGVILAIFSAIAGFGWLPYYPVWGILITFAAVAVIWALTAHGRDVTMTSS